MSRSTEQESQPTAAELKKQLDTMLSHYLATNPVVRNNMQASELEVRFGTNPKKGKHISKVDYDNVISRLMSCGFICDNMQGITMLRITPEIVDKTTGITKMSNIRAEIIGAELVQQYCRTNSIKKLIDMPVNNDYKMKFTQKSPAMTTDGTNRTPIKKIQFSDFNFNVSFNIERDYEVGSKHVEDIIRSWTESRKTFRLINRVKFYKPDSPIIVDLSIIRNSSPSGGVMIPTHTMEESGIFSGVDHCEVELEVENSKVGVGTPYNVDRVTALSDELRRVIRVVLSGLQGTNFPVSYPEQEEVIQSYMRLVHGEGYVERRISPRDFIGPSSCTLQLKNVVDPVGANTEEPNIRDGYCVTDKADGDRKMLYVHYRDGKVYLINTNMLVQFTGCVATERTIWNTLIDGEHIKYNNRKEFINTYAAFDIYYLAGKSVRELDFAPTDATVKDEKKQYRLQLLTIVTRAMKLTSVLKDGKPAEFKMNVKKFYPATQGKSIFDACHTVLSDVKDNVYPYMTDGLIFTPMATGVGGMGSGQTSKLEKFTWPMSFKWKPPVFNTIDFLVTYKTDKDGKEAIHTAFENGVSVVRQEMHYRTLELRCGFDKNVHAFMNPFQDLLDGKIPPAFSRDRDHEDRYVPMPFQPTNPYDAEAYLANVHMVKENDNLFMVTEEGERFEDNMIVEFSYDPSKERGWRWIPLRVRHDKTYNLRAGNKEFGNAYHVANDNWKSIHHPVTEEMITTGAGIPSSDATDDVYYNKSKNDQISYTRALRNFHNLYVKKKLIEGVSRRGDTLIDYAVGKAGDMSKWKSAGVKFVFGIDVSKDNIYNQNNGACARYLTERSKTPKMFDAIFLPGNSSLNIRSGEAYFNSKEHAISDAIFGKGPKDATKMGANVYNHYGIGEKGFNVSSCQFALHYFFESGTTFHNFLRNISENTAPGGHFIATCYDGQTVFDLLRSKRRDESIGIYVNEGKDKIFEIQKQYDYTGFSDDETSLGYAINVFQESINKYAVEYLVNYEFFRRSMENYGFVLVSDTEARDFGFDKGSGLFNDLYAAMKRDVNKNPAVAKMYDNALTMTDEEKRISFLNRYFIFKKAHNVNAEKVTKMLAIVEAEEKAEAKAEEKKAEEIPAEEIPAKKSRAKKIKNVAKIQLDDYQPLVIAEDEHAVEDKRDAKEAAEVGEVIVSAATLNPSMSEKLKEQEKIKEKEKLKEKESEKEKKASEKQEKKCPKGTKKYAPIGSGCYTQEEIDTFKLNKTKKVKGK